MTLAAASIIPIIPKYIPLISFEWYSKMIQTLDPASDQLALGLLAAGFTGFGAVGIRIIRMTQMIHGMDVIHQEIRRRDHELPNN